MSNKFSVIIPFYNSEKSLKRAINSVISQDFQNWELILVNDGSIDDSETIAVGFLNDSRISYFHQTNKGVSVARNKGASIAVGNWLIFLDSDDELCSNVLNRMDILIRDYPHMTYFHFGIRMIYSNRIKEIFPHKNNKIAKLPGSFLLKSDVFKVVGGYDEFLNFSENTELFHRIDLNFSLSKTISWISVNHYDNHLGASKKIHNVIICTEYILTKHSLTLNSDIKYLYHQLVGVLYIRMNNILLARFQFIHAIRIKPWKIQTWLRYFLTFFPLVAKYIYKPNV